MTGACSSSFQTSAVRKLRFSVGESVGIGGVGRLGVCVEGGRVSVGAAVGGGVGWVWIAAAFLTTDRGAAAGPTGAQAVILKKNKSSNQCFIVADTCIGITT